MNIQTFLVALALAAAPLITLAQQTETATEAEAPTEIATETETGSLMAQRLEEMQALMEKMNDATSQEGRGQLIVEHRQKMREAMRMARGMNSNGGRKGEVVAVDPAVGMDAAPMMERMGKMQAHLDKMMGANDPAERKKLMMEHREKMRSLMAMMRSMHSGPSQDKGRQMAADSDDMMMRSLMAAYQQMDKRLDTMQLLLEQMVRN